MAQNNLGGNGADADAGSVIGVIVALVVVGFIAFNFVIPAMTKKDDPFRSRSGVNNVGVGPPRNPWEPDPREVEAQRQREAEARRQFEQDRTRLNERLDQNEQQIRSFDREDKYQDAAAMVNALSREYAEANRLHSHSRLQEVQRSAVHTTFKLAKRKAAKLLEQDRYSAAAEVIDQLASDVRGGAGEVGMADELENLRQAYQFVKDVAQAAEKGDTK